MQESGSDDGVALRLPPLRLPVIGRRLLRAAVTPASIAVAIATVTIAGAQQQTAPAQPPERSSEVLRVGVDLVQVDATVTDRRGRHVPDLTAADFEILQDGRRQRITTFAYVTGAAAAAPARIGAGPRPPAAPLKTNQVRRTIAIVVDDLGLSFESMYRARDVIRTFLDKQMQPGDLVAIIRTGAGSGALQQFTSDRRLLDAALERVRWNIQSRVSPFEVPDPADRMFERQRSELITAGTLGAIRYVVRGIGELPGRKSLIVLSDGFHLTDADGNHGRILDDLRSLTDAANRAGVVVYTVDARGLMVTGPSAADRGPEAADERSEERRATQDALGYLSAETGGLFMRDNNDLSAGVQRALDDQQGYYLLGYAPDGGTFGGGKPRFHRLTVRTTRRDLRVRSRRGFFGIPDRDRPPQTPANRMVGAVMSPFAGGDIRMRLSSFFGVEKTIPVMLSVMHVDARDLTFTRQPDGSHKGEVETLAVTFGEDGAIADQNSRRFTFTLTDEALKRAMETGFIYRTRVPLKRAGPYQLRIAFRDVAADRVGSASQFIDVPDVKKGRLTLSGLVIDGTAARSAQQDDTSVETTDPRPSVALRMFRPGSEAAYFCEVYNVKRGRDGQGRIESETRMYRDGVEVFKSESREVKRLPDGRDLAAGILQFPQSMPLGDYVLEITVTDRTPKKPVVVKQTIDFQIAR